jgi:predicted PurR-regulated permease PerM
MDRRRWVSVRVRRLTALAVGALLVFLFVYYNRAFRVAGFGLLAVTALAAALEPLMKYVPTRRRWVAGAVVGLLPASLLVLTVALSGWLLVSPIKTEVAKWPAVQQGINASLEKFSAHAGHQQPLTVQSIAARFSPSGGAGGSVVKATAIAEDLFLATIIVCFGTIFFLVAPRGLLLDPVLATLPRRRQREQLRTALDELYPQLRWWVIGTLVAMVVVGAASWVGFRLAGLQFGTPLALLAGLSEIVPNVGPAVTFLIALAFAATQGWTQVLYVSILWIIIHIIEGYIIWPLVMKRAVELPPIVSLMTIIFWGEMFGVTGLLLAVPLDLLVWSLAKYFLMRPVPEERTA